jgi:hypothetical protein
MSKESERRKKRLVQRAKRMTKRSRNTEAAEHMRKVRTPKVRRGKR